ncbi:MAG: phosphotransferase [Dehalococcoidales bacterium]|nr:phosphotransferase [Dehalococcoidales bacterium]
MSDSRLGPLIGTGRRAEVYAWKDEQVVKLLREGFERDAEKEMPVIQAAFNAGLPVPAVEGLVEVEGRRGIVLERITGPSMLGIIEKQPWEITHLARVLAELHIQVHSHETEALPSQRDIIQTRVHNDARLPPAVKDALLGTLRRLPDGNAICHSDFHPGNIIMSPRGPVIIDWVDAKRGNPLADVARTWLLSTMAILPMDLNIVIRLLAKVVHKLLWSTYVKQYRRLQPFLLDELEDWKLLKAYERLPEVPEERERLVAFIGTALRGYRPSVSAG